MRTSCNFNQRNTMTREEVQQLARSLDRAANLVSSNMCRYLREHDKETTYMEHSFSPAFIKIRRLNGRVDNVSTGEFFDWLRGASETEEIY